MPSQRSLFLLSVLTLFAGFSMTVAGWQGRVAVSAIGSMGVLWFHFRASYGANRVGKPIWTRHFLILSFIIANLLRGLGLGIATGFFILMVVALMADVYVSGSAMMPLDTMEDEKLKHEDPQVPEV
ncbi:MAG: hypothetical protein K9J06_06535 [Flavobacteriales bacterium]|nr:hypothetical protein [Flavobacteriales bacterium]